MNYTEKQKIAFINNLKTYMGLYKISQKELARKLGTKQPVISAWVNGKSTPREEMLIKVAKSFLLTKEQILDAELGREKQPTTTDIVSENKAVLEQVDKDNSVSFIEEYFKNAGKVKDYVSKLIIENDDLRQEIEKLKSQLAKFENIKDKISRLFD